VSDRLPSGLLVSALLRRVNDAGGIGMVLAKGDAQAGGILVLVQERDVAPRFIERGLGPDGAARLIETGPQDPKDPTDPQQAADYWQRRRARDPDLWVIELDIAGGERFAAVTIVGR
jgi:hypothetical protein